MWVVQWETPCDVVIYGASLRCLSGTQTAAVNFTQHWALSMFEWLFCCCLDHGDKQYRARFCDTGWKSRTFTGWWKPCRGKIVRLSSSIALVGGHEGVIVESNPFLSAIIWKEGWTDIRGRVAFPFQGMVGRIEAEVQVFHSYLFSSWLCC